MITRKYLLGKEYLISENIRQEILEIVDKNLLPEQKPEKLYKIADEIMLLLDRRVIEK